MTQGIIPKVLETIGLCNHKWKFVRKIEGDLREVDVCECIKCGKREGFRVW